MVEKDVEMFLEACELKGLSMKTIGSYEQTLRLFMQHLYKIGIERTENVTHLTIQGYIQEIRRRGKYTRCDESGCQKLSGKPSGLRKTSLRCDDQQLPAESQSVF